VVQKLLVGGEIDWGLFKYFLIFMWHRGNLHFYKKAFWKDGNII
jgi:hypothetical protein